MSSPSCWYIPILNLLSPIPWDCLGPECFLCQSLIGPSAHLPLQHPLHNTHSGFHSVSWEPQVFPASGPLHSCSFCLESVFWHSNLTQSFLLTLSWYVIESLPTLIEVQTHPSMSWIDFFFLPVFLSWVGCLWVCKLHEGSDLACLVCFFKITDVVFRVTCYLSINVSSCPTKASLGVHLSRKNDSLDSRIAGSRHLSNKSHCSNFKQKMHQLCFPIATLCWSKLAQGHSPGSASPGAEHRTGGSWFEAAVKSVWVSNRIKAGTVVICIQ